MTTNLSNLKSKVDKSDVDKLSPIPVDLSKLSDALKLTLATKTTLNAKINDVKGEIPSTTNLATTAALNAKIN